MTINVAQDAVRNKIPVILTNSGSFACHGANILRSLAEPRPIWITDILNLGELEEGWEIEIYGHQIALADLSDQQKRSHSRPSKIAEAWQRGLGHEIVDWDISYDPPRVIQRCYWSHRRYDPLTASVMIPGLRANIKDMTGTQARIETDQIGLLWFRRAPSTDFIASLAVNEQLGRAPVSHQIEVYDGLLNAFQNLGDDWYHILRQVTRLLKSYFTVHLLLHNTYEMVFIRCRDHLLSSGWSQSQAISLLEIILTPSVVRWQARWRMDNYKDLLAAAHRITAPSEESPSSDASEQKGLVSNFLDRYSPAPVSLQVRDYCIYAADVAVAKEWKFVLNKLLYSAFGEAIHTLCGRLKISPEEARFIPIRTILDFAKAAQV